MTRENKLALVVGFGLILLVGVLISDHFSTARSQESADLNAGRAVDPLSQARRADPGLIELQPRSERPGAGELLRNSPLAMNTTHVPATAAADAPAAAHNEQPPAAAQSNGVQRVVMGEPITEPAIRTILDPTASDAGSYTFHNVQPGETLTAICRRYYGDTSLVKELAAANGLNDVDSLRVNHRLRIPAAAALIRGERPAATPASPARAEPAPVYSTYTVKRGDTLSELSLQLLGTSRRWRELHELNRDVIPDPDNLQAGVTLKVPK